MSRGRTSDGGLVPRAEMAETAAAVETAAAAAAVAMAVAMAGKRGLGVRGQRAGREG